MKIYVIITDEVYEFENFEHAPIAFYKREDADAELNSIKEQVKEEFKNEFETFDETKNGFEMYADGYYSQGHYTAYIYEVEVK